MLKKLIVGTLIAFGLLASQVAALSTFQVTQGGTGSTTLSGILMGNGTSPINTLTIGTNLTLSGTTLNATGGGSGFSTTSADFWILQYPKGFFFSTTSANNWKTVNVFTGASTTLLVDNNGFSGTNIFSKALTLSSVTGTTTIASGQGFTIGSNQFVVQGGTGNVGVGTNGPIVPFNVGNAVSYTNNASSSIIGGTTVLGALADNFDWVSEFRNISNNTDRLLFGEHRTVAGSSWTSAAWRIQPAVDNSFTAVNANKGYLEFAFGTSGSYLGIGLSGTGNTTPDFVVSSTGKEGVGTTTPTQLISVSGSVPLATFYDTTNNRIATFGIGDALNATVNSVTGSSILQTGGVGRLVATANGIGINNGSTGNNAGVGLYVASGNVGVGTASPWTNLTVNGGIGITASSTIGDGTKGGGLTIAGAATSTNGFIVTNGAASSEAGSLTVVSSTFSLRDTNANGINFLDSFNNTFMAGVAGGATPRFGIGTSTPWGTLSLTPVASGAAIPQFVSWVSGSSTPSFIVSSANNNGNVGISTTTPGSTFSVGSVANFTAATSTFYSTGGIVLTGGCLTYTVGGACIGGAAGGVTSVSGTWPILSSGGNTPVISWGGLSTTTNLTTGQIVYASGAGTLTSVATSTLSASSPLTGSFIQIGSAGTLGIQAASASQTGSLAAADFQLIHAATTTFSAPLVYTQSTNAVTCTNASNGVTGCMSAADWGLLHTATTTFSGPLVYTLSTNAVTCPTCYTGTGITTFGNYATTTAAAISLSTSTLAFNGLTFGVTASVTPNAILFTPTVTGTLGNAGLTNQSVTFNGVAVNLGSSGTINAASSTLLGDFNNWTKLQTLANATSTLFTSTNSWLTYASTTALSATTICLTGDICRTTWPTAGSSASTTLLADNNWWTGLQKFNQASTSMLTATSTVWLTSLGTPAGTFLAVDPAGKIIATSTPIGGSASTTLLTDNNTFSGNNIFSQPLSLTSTTGTTTLASGQGFTIGGSQFVLQQGSGRVGIGKSNPAYALDVVGGAQFSNNIFTPTAGTGLFFTAGFGSGVYRDSNGQVELFNGNLSTPQLTVNTNGNIGIGTTTPGTLFSLAGTSGILASTTATSTFQGGGINLITAAGNTGCFAVNGVCISSSGSSASTTLLSDNNTFSGNDIFTKPLVVNSTTGTSSFSGAISMKGWVLSTTTTVCLYPQTCQFVAATSTSDVAINAAITSVLSQGGGTVNIEPGTYTLNAPITIAGDGVVLKGESNNGTILKLKNSFNDYAIKVDDAVLRSRLVIRYLQINGNSTNQTSGGCIVASSTARSTFDTLNLQSCFGDALKLAGVAGGGFGYNNTISNNYINDNNIGIEMVSNDENQIYGNTINSSKTYHIEDEQGLSNIHDNVFTGVAYTTGIGIYVPYTVNDQINNNTFDSVPYQAIYLLCNASQGQHTVTNNYIFKADNSGAGKAAITVDGCTRNMFSGNYTDIGSQSYAYQEINNAPTATAMSNNFFYGTTSAYSFFGTGNASSTSFFNNATSTPPSGMYWGQVDALSNLGFNVPTNYSSYFAVNGTKVATFAGSTVTLPNASTTLLTAPTLWTGLTAYNILTTDVNGKMVASSTIGNNLLAASGVSGTTCTNCNLTYNTQGIITVASNGSAGGAGVWPFTAATNDGQSVQSTTTAEWFNVAPFALMASGTVDVWGQAGGYAIDEKTILQASTTNQSLMVGQSAGSALLSTSLNNVAVGFQALQLGTTTNSNVAIGFQAMKGGAVTADVLNNGNVAIGAQALLSVTTGGGALTQANTAIGSSTLRLLTVGSGNVALGGLAGSGITNGSNNTIAGLNAERGNASNVSAFGQNALAVNTGTNNSGFGLQTLLLNTTGFNDAFGSLSLSKVTTGGSNAAFGRNAMASTTGNGNSGFGENVGTNIFNTSSASSTFFGAFAGYGPLAGYGETGTVAIGAGSGFNFASSSNWNTCVGTQSCFNLTSGADNIIIGSASTTANDNLTTGSDNIKIGDNISFPSATANGQLDIGNLIYGTGLNTTGSTISGGFIGIASTTPGYLLSIGNTAEFPSLTSATSTIWSSLLIATTSPNAFVVQDQWGLQDLIVGTASTTGNIFQVMASTSPNGSGCGTNGGTCYFTISQQGAIAASSTAPVLSSCGTTPGIDGTSNGGRITIGGTATGCTVTFPTNFWSKTPECTVSNQSMSITSALTYTVTATALTLSQAVGFSGNIINYHCGIGT